MDEKPFSEMPKVRLTRIEPLDVNVRVDTADRQFEAIEFAPDADKRYVFTVEVGDQHPKQVQEQLHHVMKMIRQFMPDDAKNCLLIPSRNGHPAMGIYEVTPA
jgi:hypothetical protein